MSILELSKLLIDSKNDIINKGKKLGSGSFGEVVKAQYQYKKHHQYHTVDCAVKYLPKDKFDNQAMQRLISEMRPMVVYTHPTLIHGYGFSMPFADGDFCIVMEYAEHGSLKNILSLLHQARAPGDWSETNQAICIIGIAAGMLYLHQHNTMHRDLKSENILLDENYYPKICDFGLAKFNKQGIQDKLNQTQAGTPSYEAPEIMLGDAYNNKVDVFSYAMILYEMFAYVLPYEDTENPVKFNLGKILKGERPQLDGRFPEFFQELINECWESSADNRPSFLEVYKKIIDAFDDEKIFEEGLYDRGQIEDYIALVNEGLDLEQEPDDALTDDDL